MNLDNSNPNRTNLRITSASGIAEPRLPESSTEFDRFRLLTSSLLGVDKEDITEGSGSSRKR